MRKRSGRPPQFTDVQVAQVKAMACTPPADKALPLSRWSCPELARQAVDDGIATSISSATERRWLSENAIKPWQYRVNHDYHRRGAIAYLAAYDVHRSKVFGRCEGTTGIAAFERLADHVMCCGRCRRRR
jgi:hypothetical protein